MQPNFPHAPVRRLAAAALCLALAACAAVGPDYAPPAVDHPDAWSTPLPGAGSASDPVHWWRAFQDPCWTNWWRRRWRATRTWRSRASACLQARAERDQAASRLGPGGRGRRGVCFALVHGPALSAGPGRNPDLSIGIGCQLGDRRVRWSPPRWRPPMRRRRPRKRGPGAARQSAGRAGLQLRGAALGRSGSGSRSTRWPRWKPRGGWRRRVTSAAWARPWRRPRRAQLELGQARLPALREQARLAHAIGVLTGGFPGELKDALAQGPARMPEPPPLPSGLPSEMLRNRPDIRASGAGWPPPRRGSAWPSRNAFRASSFRWTWAARPVWSVICSRAPAWPGRSAPAPVSRCTTAGGPRRDSARRRPAPRRSAWPMNTACGGPSRTWRTRWPANAERERQAHLSAAVRDSLAAGPRDAAVPQRADRLSAGAGRAAGHLRARAMNWP